MRRVMLLAVTVMMLTGAWQRSTAQSTKPASKKKVTEVKNVTPVEPSAPTEAGAPMETAAAAPVAESAMTLDSTTPDTAHHKKKGLFGKAKGAMSNKVVKAVVKTAACTMVPGGQAIAGAIDAASSNSAGEAAAGAAGGATGSSCMPGMGGAGMGAAGLAEAGLAGAAARGMAPSASGYAPGMGGNGMLMAGGYEMMPDPKPMADCMGLTLEEYNAMINPTSGEPRQMTKAEMKRVQQLSKRVGSQRQVACSQSIGMQQANAQGIQLQQMMAHAQVNVAARTAVAGSEGAAMSEAPGQKVELASDLAAELKKGKTTVRGIDWVAGSADVSAAGRPAFDEAMAKLAQAMKESGQRYRLDLYMDQRYDEAAVSAFGPTRLQAVQSALTAAIGDPAAAPQIGKTKLDKNPRLELVKSK